MAVLAGVIPVLRYLLEGWSYCADHTFSGSDWIQQGGCGKGGQTHRIHGTTSASIRRNRYVVYPYQFPSSQGMITDAGRRKAGMQP